MQVDKICFTNFVDLTRLTHLPWLILQPLVASTTIIYESSFKPHAFSWIFTKNSFNKNIYIRMVAITT
jgi:hypothetical protein